MTRRVASFYPQRVNLWFDKAVIGGFGADGSPDIAVMDLGAPATRDVDGLLVAQDMTTAGTTSTFAAAYLGTEAQMGKYGRNIVVDASGASTALVRVQGRDYLGQPMTETLTLNGTAAVQGIKAFRFVDVIGWNAEAGVNLTVGWDNSLGVPYRCLEMISEIKNNTVAANAGALTAGLAVTSTAGATNADPRGLYTPSTALPNGSTTFVIRCVVDKSYLLGVQHYFTAL